jgi:hypothetical protein
MENKTFVSAAAMLLAVFVFAVARFLSTRDGQPALPRIQVDNNPQKFYLWSTGSSFAYTFTCDPRAVDVWLFRSAGGTMFVLRPQPEWRRSSTNDLDVQ